jgi:integrase
VVKGVFKRPHTQSGQNRDKTVARKIRNSKLESRSARLKLPVRQKPYTGPSLERGVALLYRRNKTDGSWVIKASNGHGDYWTKVIGAADDYADADGKEILNFYEAQGKARELVRGGGDTSDTAPITVSGALDDYETDLETRNANPHNASGLRVHLPGVLLAKPVQLLASHELRKWRDGLLAKVKPATVNRLCNALCAALTLASRHDKRVQNQGAWVIGLARLPDANQPRNVILTDAQVLKLVDAAYAHDRAFGLLVDVLATTGQRISQLLRLRVEDLTDGAKPKLSVSKSAKGGGRNRSQKKREKYSVPITPALATGLREAAGGRVGDVLLLVRIDGSPWTGPVFRHMFRKIVAQAGLDSGVVTGYSLRHSSVVRALLKNVPVRVVAAGHNTSVAMIERTYSRYIAEHSDELSRSALLQPLPPPGSNVALISGR